MEDKLCIGVIVPVKIGWEPCYFAPTADVESGKLGVGSRVRVIFAGRMQTGVVSSLKAKPFGDPARIRDILGIVEGVAPVSKEEIDFWRFLAGYYLCTVGEVFKAAYPFGKQNIEEISSREEERKRKRKEKAELAMSLKITKLEERKRRLSDALERARKDTVRQRVTEQLTALDASLEQLARALDGLRGKATLSNGGTATGSGMATESVTSAGTETAIGAVTGSEKSAKKLTKDQKQAEKEILAGFQRGKTVLLNGVTGSGKTEIYIDLARRTLAEGLKVLYLVPEIAVGGQIISRLSDAFGERLFPFHSALTPGQKNAAVSAARNEGECVIAGTRSAIFLPLRKLGLIIVDEEHERSYKQDSPAPRYNARDSAVMLASIHSARILLGSATPSLESLYNCTTGRYVQVNLSSRYYGTANSEVVIIDTKAERKKRGMRGSFSVKLLEMIRKVLDEGSQVAVMCPRRAYSPAVQCQECGEIPKCPHCNVSLSYHADTGRLQCHHCAYSAPFEGSCPKCGGKLLPLGTGTQKIQAELSQLFPEARICRVDSDSSMDREALDRSIKDFEAGAANVMVGTAMVSKGFDFERLKLVAVIQADAIAGAQDFRADERCLQLLEQFRGRCGRRGERGVFVLQTASPEHPVFELLSGKTSENFLAGQFSQRRDFLYPPFTRIVELTVSDDNEPRLDKLSRALFDCLSRDLAGAALQITEPCHPLVDKVADEFLRCLRLVFRRDKSLSDNKKRLYSVITSFEREYKYPSHLAIDVDPV